MLIKKFINELDDTIINIIEHSENPKIALKGVRVIFANFVSWLTLQERLNNKRMINLIYNRIDNKLKER